MGAHSEVERKSEAMEELSESECYALLERRVLGRIAVVHNGIPRVFPVNYKVDRGSIVFRADAGMKLEAASEDRVATFEVDYGDPLFHTGWSVMVTGALSIVTNPNDLRVARSLPIRAWGTRGSNWVRLRPLGISGRRIVRPASVT